MHIRRITKQSRAWPYTREKHEFVLDPHVNVFIGPNACGKTAILRALDLWLGDIDLDSVEEAASSGFWLGLSEDMREEIEAFLRTGGHTPETLDFDVLDIGGLEYIYFMKGLYSDRVTFIEANRRAANQIGFLSTYEWVLAQTEVMLERVREIVSDDPEDAFDPRTVDRRIDNRMYEILRHTPESDEYDVVTLPILEEVERLQGKTIVEVAKETGRDFLEIYAACGEQAELYFGPGFWSIIPDEDVFMRASGFQSKAYANLMQAICLSYFCAREICPEIVAKDLPLDDTRIIEDKSSGGIPSISASRDIGVRIKTNDVNSKGGYLDPLKAEELSSGTGETIWWIRKLANTLLKANNYKFGWDQKPGVLLIDEIENHLHPTWQRKVIPALRKYFPNVQIFATTHSPFVVAGLKTGQVHLLNRDANGVVTATTNTEDIVGWTADEILRTMMGVKDPTDDATARHAAELRRLRDEGPRDTADAEEQRLTRLQELRRLVDRDLLAGGPAAAQRESFEQQFAEALENYRQSRELGQENG